MRILAVDDDEEDIEILSECLHDVDASVSLFTARNGREALTHLKHTDQLPDLLLLDVNMPVMGGIECLSAIRSENQFNDLHIILFSTSVDLSRSALHQYCNVRYMDKPFHVEGYVTALKSVLADFKNKTGFFLPA